MIYQLTVTASPGLRVRAVENGSPNIGDFFKFGDKLTADRTVMAGGMAWYRITQCLRNGVNVALPYTENWAGAGASNEFLRVDSVTEPTQPNFPQSFTMTDPSGNRAEYAFVREIK